MIITEQLDERRTFTYSDKNKWIRQLETGNLYESAVDYVPHTYEETDISILLPESDPKEILEILLGGEP